MSPWTPTDGSWCARPARRLEVTTHFDVDPPDWWVLVTECVRGDDREVDRDPCRGGLRTARPRRLGWPRGPA